MSYVRANTGPVFGMRSQALSPMASRLGYYFPSGYPLPTTSMSRPFGRTPAPSAALGSAFFDGPFPEYPQPEVSATRSTATRTLNGEWVPPTPPGRALFQQGAVTYRINPATGQYEFRSTDMLPRGLWEQNTFQHPVPPALSSLGVPVGSRGVSLVQIGGRNVVMKTSPIRQGRVSNEPLMKLRSALAGMFSGCGCSCGGRCKGLGDDLPPGTFETCRWDPDGNLEPGSPLACSPTAPGSGGSGSTRVEQVVTGISNGVQQVTNTINPRPAVQTTFTPPSWFSGSTNIAGTNIPNVLLAGGGLLLIASVAGRHK